MDKIKILDCTLRDGGYINNFNFGLGTMQDIVNKLVAAGIDIIECGFLQSGQTDQNKSLFGSIADIKCVIGAKKNPETMYVAMIQYGKISSEEIEPYDGTSIDGIRITFHESEIKDALVLGRQLMEKNYKIFMQPVGTTTFSDEVLLELIYEINCMKPYAFYLVDTLGTMYVRDLRHYFYLIDYNLDKSIRLGFHAHNNLQLAFSNAQELMHMDSPRDIILDATVFGMGRGAGNLSTELIVQYINENIERIYDTLPVLQIIDDHISILRKKYDWGYMAEYYLSASKKCHPNYASFLINAKTLMAEDINRILEEIDAGKKSIYDAAYIKELYVKYKSRQVNDEYALATLKKEIGTSKVLLVAPGLHLKDISNDQMNHICEAYYVIPVNCLPKGIHFNRVFISNEKRYESGAHQFQKISRIVTSNIVNQSTDNCLVVNYASYLNDGMTVPDNAGMMCINLLKALGVSEIALAGFDGFTENTMGNYVSDDFMYSVDKEQLAALNNSIRNHITKLRREMQVTFLTESLYDT